MAYIQVTAENANGRGCLHIAFEARLSGPKPGWGWERNFWAIINHLIEKAADIYLVSIILLNVTETAFTTDEGKLWLRTLDACPHIPNALEVLLEDHKRYH